MNYLIMELCVIYGGSALLATLFLYLKQPVVLAYIFAGLLCGPYSLGLVKDPENIEKFAHFGIILLMFLIGINLNIKELGRLLQKTALLTLGSSAFFAIATVAILTAFKFPLSEALIAGAGLMFSSTVVALKLLPTTDLHNKRLGELMVSILLFQDIMAIVIILILAGGGGQSLAITVPLLIIKTVLLFVVCYFLVKNVVFNLFRKFDVIQEYIFIFVIGWCLALAQIAASLDLSYEIGAFIAGISMAVSPIAMIIAEKLKPLREFFLILFFFSIGAQFHPESLVEIAIPGTILAVFLVILKPLAFSWGFRKFKETPETAMEMGVRLGQGSEFTLLVGVTALADQMISKKTFMLMEYTVILTFMLSTYWVMKKYATPISTDAKRRRD